VISSKIFWSRATRTSTGSTGTWSVWRRTRRDREALAGVFRTIHTIKGTCGFLGFNKLEKVAHVGENLLTRLRDGQLTLNPEITTALLGMVDAVRQMLREIESTGQDGEVDYPELRETLTRLQQAGAPVQPPTDEGAGFRRSRGYHSRRARHAGVHATS
jgi:chemotaxis protein histidine kinase CheA